MKTQTLLNSFLLFCILCFSARSDTITVSDGPIKQWMLEIASSFDSAEKEVFVIKPKPDDIVRPDPDVKKCPCKGTGIIIHGDGHKTPCEFHGKSSQDNECPDGSCNIKKSSIKSTPMCQCETKCGCKVCRCPKMEIK
jgi:hypothetical protein